MAVLADTNILVRILDDSSAHRLACEQALAQAKSKSGELFICAQVMIKFWAVVTRPLKSGGLGLTPADADAALQDYGIFLPILPEPPDTAKRWRRLAVTHNVIGKSVHDTRLVAL
jgi:predicted nucleic acid-binding protein